MCEFVVHNPNEADIRIIYSILAACKLPGHCTYTNGFKSQEVGGIFTNQMDQVARVSLVFRQITG